MPSLLGDFCNENRTQRQLALFLVTAPNITVVLNRLCLPRRHWAPFPLGETPYLYTVQWKSIYFCSFSWKNFLSFFAFQVYIIKLLADRKFEHFRSVLDAYIHTHFSGAMAHTYVDPWAYFIVHSRHSTSDIGHISFEQAHACCCGVSLVLPCCIYV